ncbi:hypothetical protein CEXT_194081 [Caerostris extrusa]|uniref:Uncharacterized protein n=1 Tax=Caerostris extrusa TaxID=172846 RepID=A0AAV4TY55_CAEEX|nr:hypothetical protein CEXT_194081 [Caerostris extrusa]
MAPQAAKKRVEILPKHFPNLMLRWKLVCGGGAFKAVIICKENANDSPHKSISCAGCAYKVYENMKAVNHDDSDGAKNQKVIHRYLNRLPRGRKTLLDQCAGRSITIHGLLQSLIKESTPAKSFATGRMEHLFFPRKSTRLDNPSHAWSEGGMASNTLYLPMMYAA